MSGGNRSVKFNTRERAVSSDWNRAQAFTALGRAELLRYQMALRVNPLGQDIWSQESGSFADASGASTADIGQPLIGDVLDGLVVLPQPTSLNLLISPGAVGLVDPDGQTGSGDPSLPSSDDSQYKVVIDPGVQVVGALTIAAGGGGTRIDVIECKRQTVVLETDSRDIFDPSTGVFVPVTVIKVAEGRLLYRVNQGTPGAGLPAASLGWLPLCVASVPSSATSVDTMTFWDVRPLVADRVNAPFESRHSMCFTDGTHQVYADSYASGGTQTILVGVASSQIGMYRCGGRLPNLNARDAANQTPGYAPANGKPWFLYAVFPGSYPRWVRYQDSPSTRIPGGASGILTVSHLGPANQPGSIFFSRGDPTILQSASPPASTGLIASGPAALLCAGVYSAAEIGFISQNGLAMFPDGFAVVKTPATVSGASEFYRLVANTDYPKNAKGLLIEVAATFTGGTPGNSEVVNCTLYMLKPTTSSPRLAQVGVGRFSIVVPGGGSFFQKYLVEVPSIPYAADAGEATENVEFEVLWSSALTRTSQAARVIGWRL